MSDYTKGERDQLKNIALRLVRLRDFLISANLEQDKDTTQWFECLAQVKAIQGNGDNDVSFIACLMAKDYLTTQFDIDGFDVAAKAQGAAGLDIDLLSSDGKHIIGEVKTTVPYSGARNDLGAQQKESFKKDFAKLNAMPADYKFFFVTDKLTFEVVRRRYASQIPTVSVILLTTANTNGEQLKS